MASAMGAIVVLTLPHRRIIMMTDKEYLELLDFALKELTKFETAVDAFCKSIRGE